MIVKIWPVKAFDPSPNKVSGLRGLMNVVDYVRDDDKCLVKENDMDAAFIDDEASPEESFISKDADFFGTINYMSNKDKVKGRFVSGYMCDPDNVSEDFISVQKEILERFPDRTIDGNIAYHLVQSFPEDIDISDEEVHQCGMDLVEKIGKHQAFICSHVHPVTDEEGEVHGRCKHNHILINAYIHPDKIDPERPNTIKYNDCKETYRQLQIWNDEIALQHGFPIIRNPDNERKYSWKEQDAENKGLSWKQQVRNDIDNAKQKTRNWDEFLKEMNRLGYSIKDGKHTTFIAPDGSHRVRGTNLGNRYTKDNIEQYWQLRNKIRDEVMFQEIEDKQLSLDELYKNSASTLFVSIPLGGNTNNNNSTYSLPLDKKVLSQQAIDSYFDLEKFYEIRNKDDQVLESVSGANLHEYFSNMLKAENERIKQMDWWESEKEKRRWLKIQEQERKEKQYYENQMFRSSKNGQTYKVGLYTKDGRMKTDLELVFTIAIVVIHNEGGQWEPKNIPEERVQEAYFGPPAWKAQNMMDALQIAQEEGIENEFDMENRLQSTGAALSRAKKAVNRNQEIKDKMETLKKAIEDFEEVQFTVERIFNMPDGNEKLTLLHANQSEIEQYNNAKHILHSYRVETPAQITDFKKRYAQTEQNIEEAQELLNERKEEYRRLKKLKYSKSLAQDVKYCYGYDYQPPQELKIDYEHTEPPEQENTNRL